MTPEAAQTAILETLTLYEEIFDDDEWQESRLEDESMVTILQFYGAIGLVALFCTSAQVVIFFLCRAVQLSLRKGICQHTPLALLAFVSMAIKDDNAVRL